MLFDAIATGLRLKQGGPRYADRCSCRELGKSDPSVVTNTLVKETWKDYQVKSLPVKL